MFQFWTSKIQEVHDKFPRFGNMWPCEDHLSPLRRPLRMNHLLRATTGLFLNRPWSVHSQNQGYYLGVICQAHQMGIGWTIHRVLGLLCCCFHCWFAHLLLNNRNTSGCQGAPVRSSTREVHPPSQRTAYWAHLVAHSLVEVGVFQSLPSNLRYGRKVVETKVASINKSISDMLNGFIRLPIQLLKSVWRVFSGPVGTLPYDSVMSHWGFKEVSWSRTPWVFPAFCLSLKLIPNPDCLNHSTFQQSGYTLHLNFLQFYTPIVSWISIGLANFNVTHSLGNMSEQERTCNQKWSNQWSPNNVHLENLGILLSRPPWKRLTNPYFLIDQAICHIQEYSHANQNPNVIKCR